MRESAPQRAEHNDGMLADLHELTLHQQNIEAIELIGQACRQLRVLYLTNNLISSLRGLEHLKAGITPVSAIHVSMLMASSRKQRMRRAVCAGAHLLECRSQQLDLYRPSA